MIQMPAKTHKTPAPIVLNKFLGINQDVADTEIKDAETPDMLNMILDDQFAPVKRYGYKKLVDGGINKNIYTAFVYDHVLYFITDDGLYKIMVQHPDNPVYVYELVYSNTFSSNVNAFLFNDKCYFLDMSMYYQFNGTQVQKVEDIAYIPTLFIATTPNGAGTYNEDWNLIGKGFKISYTADGTSQEYNLGIKGLDATQVKATVNGTEKTEGTDFTVDRVNGTVHFNTSPAKGDPDNVIITAYKTYTDKLDIIRKCLYSMIYGGANDTRAFLGGCVQIGNSNTIYQSGLEDATYFPENGYIKLGSEFEVVKGFSKQYDYAVIFTDQNVYSMSYDATSETDKFPTKPIGEGKGCISINSIQLIDNKPTYMNKDGIMQVTQTSIKDERNFKILSAAVNKTLLQGSFGIVDASYDYKNKYIYSCGKTFIYDYIFEQWYIWDNIPARKYFEYNGRLMFVGNNDIYFFKNNTDTDPYSDNGQPINAYWKSKVLDFGTSIYKKMVKNVRVTLKPDISTSLNLSFKTDQHEVDNYLFKRADTFTFKKLNFNKFSFIVSNYPRVKTAKLKEKGLNYFQLILSNNTTEPFGILRIEIEYDYGSKNK